MTHLATAVIVLQVVDVCRNVQTFGTAMGSDSQSGSIRTVSVRLYNIESRFSN